MSEQIQENQELEDKRKNSDFIQFYRKNLHTLRDIIDLDPTAAKIFFFITEQMDRANALVCSSKVLEEYTRLGRTTIYNKLKFLQEKGFLQIFKSGVSNVFVLNDDIVWTSWNTGKDYCVFDHAKVILSKSEQEKNASMKFRAEFKKTAINKSDKLQLSGIYKNVKSYNDLKTANTLPEDILDDVLVDDNSDLEALGLHRH